MGIQNGRDYNKEEKGERPGSSYTRHHNHRKTLKLQHIRHWQISGWHLIKWIGVWWKNHNHYDKN